MGRLRLDCRSLRPASSRRESVANLTPWPAPPLGRRLTHAPGYRSRRSRCGVNHCTVADGLSRAIRPRSPPVLGAPSRPPLFCYDRCGQRSDTVVKEIGFPARPCASSRRPPSSPAASRVINLRLARIWHGHDGRGARCRRAAIGTVSQVALDDLAQLVDLDHEQVVVLVIEQRGPTRPGEDVVDRAFPPVRLVVEPKPSIAGHPVG